MFVFPAYAGMFPVQKYCKKYGLGFPRIRGDVPRIRGVNIGPPAFSPHTRGCSGSVGLHPGHYGVFPAYAGMFRRLLMFWATGVCFPRIRGDVPSFRISVRERTRFSPHTRGCSGRFTVTVARLLVFPAYAGMFLHLGNHATKIVGFPRIRGDVPNWLEAVGVELGFSPHTRGCS